MHIQMVKILDCKFLPQTGRHQATLLMEGDKRRVSFCTAVESAEDARIKDVIQGLFADALRQLRRMPEYRNSDQPITYDDSALAA